MQLLVVNPKKSQRHWKTKSALKSTLKCHYKKNFEPSLEPFGPFSQPSIYFLPFISTHYIGDSEIGCI
ncbi:uncharacterized protein YALI1_C04868g [Yarrowia lipolytica]|uniref:Uncharacterized protein n=1 Tax=Yarrowia lipolytica TaxID=4952 RepID=A0A1D8N9I4_YARLL|nr:hypothetical protein YALI1_C04868g [Yarrowia lipolytica]